MQSRGLSAAVKRGFAHLTLRKTSLNDQLPANPVAVDDATDRIRLDVSSLERGLYFISIRHDSDYPLTGPRLTAVRPEFETADHIFTFVRRDQREFYGTVLIVDDIEALHFYPSRLPCKLEIHDCSVRLINTLARDYIYGESYVRLKSFGAAWTWAGSRTRPDSASPAGSRAAATTATRPGGASTGSRVRLNWRRSARPCRDGVLTPRPGCRL